MSSNLSTSVGTGLALITKTSAVTTAVNSGGLAIASGSSSAVLGAASATALCTVGIPLAVFGVAYCAYLATRNSQPAFRD